SRTFNFDSEAAGKGPAGFTSYATGGGPAGKWVVMEMNDAPSGKAVVVLANRQTSTLASRRSRFPERLEQGMGLVFRFRDPKIYYIVRSQRSGRQLQAVPNGERQATSVCGRPCQGYRESMAHDPRRGQGGPHYM